MKQPSTTASQPKGTTDLVGKVPSRLHALPLELQQVILNVFGTAFPMAQNVESLTHIVQAVKGHLFNRDFSSAFGQPSYLQVYALRWSAARALGYSHILTHPDRASLLTMLCAMSDQNQTESLSGNTRDSLAGNRTESVSKVVCIGGGAGGEVVALAAAYRQLDMKSLLQIIAVDSADWSDPIAKLSLALTTAPTLSTHASEAAKARIENQPLLDDPLKVTVSFIHQDVLTWDLEAIKQTLKGSALCTIMFTLNELFSSSLPKATSFLLNVTTAMPEGSQLLVVDSPGSYSEIQLRRSSQVQSSETEQEAAPTKKYPMKWLLDHTLLEVARSGNDAAWEKVESEDSLWFRIDQKERDKLRYPVELEHMRYQLHCYRRLRSPQSGALDA